VNDKAALIKLFEPYSEKGTRLMKIKKALNFRAFLFYSLSAITQNPFAP